MPRAPRGDNLGEVDHFKGRVPQEVHQDADTRRLGQSGQFRALNIYVCGLVFGVEGT